MLCAYPVDNFVNKLLKQLSKAHDFYGCIRLSKSCSSIENQLKTISCVFMDIWIVYFLSKTRACGGMCISVDFEFFCLRGTLSAEV